MISPDLCEELLAADECGRQLWEHLGRGAWRDLSGKTRERYVRAALAIRRKAGTWPW